LQIESCAQAFFSMILHFSIFILQFAMLFDTTVIIPYGIRFSSTVTVVPEVLILARTGMRAASSVNHTSISPLRLM
jgi:hypothetical protein